MIRTLFFSASLVIFVLSGYGQTSIEWYNNGNKKLEEGNYLGAVKDYTTAITLDSNFAEAYLGRGSVYAELETFDMALRDLAKCIQINPKVSEAFFNRAFIYLSLGQQEDALRDMRIFCELNPSDIDAHLAQLDLLFELQHKKEVTPLMQKIALIPAKDFMQYFQRGRIKTMINDTSSAISDLTKALELNPNFLDVYKFRASLYVKTKQFTEAIQDLNIYLLNDREDVDAFKMRAEAHAGLNEISLAIDNFSSAIALKPTAAELYFDRGYFLITSKYYEDAAIDLKQCIKLGFRDRELLYYNLGIAEFHTTGKEMACLSWQKSGEIGKEYREKYCN